MIVYGMLYAMAVGLPIALAAMLASGVLRKQGRAERGVWLLALGLAMTLPPLALARPGEEPVAALPSVVETGLIGLPTVVPVPAPPTIVAVPVARSALGLDELLVGLWLLASLILGLRWAVANLRLARLTASCPSATVDGVPVSLTSELGPGVSGVLRPRILVPSWLLSMPQGQRSLVLAHEEEHIRARDPALIAVLRLARILTPWNPVVWLLSSRLMRAVELDCDRRVLRRHPDVGAYGTTLLTVSSRDPSALLGAAAFAESEAPLRRRILAMTTPPTTVSVVGVLTALVLGALLIVGVFEVPIPTFRMEVGTEPQGSGTVDVERPTPPDPAIPGFGQGSNAREGDDATQRVKSLEEEVRMLRASQVEATRRVEAAEAVLQELTERLRGEGSGPPPHRPAEARSRTDAVRTGTITGVVRDATSDRPMKSVQVFVRGTGVGSLSNDEGRFLLLHVPVGERQVVAQLIGHGEVTQTVDVGEGESAALEFRLSQTAIELDGVLVTETSTDPEAALRGSEDGHSGPLIYVDGVRVQRPDGALESYLDGLAESPGVERVEIIKGPAATALYGEEASAGVVLISLKAGSAARARPIRPAVAGQPVFTPFSVAPRVLNLAQVRDAMVEAYPPELRTEGIGGTVEVYFYIEEDGRVRDTRIFKSSGHPALDDAALAVARVYRFSPALNRDQRIPVWVAFPITFVQGR